MTAPIVEIFSSVQGEGLLVGERQVFLRFAGCNLCCAYCDTPGAQVIPVHARIETSSSPPLPQAGVGPFTEDSPAFSDLPNPLTPSDIADAIRRLVRPQPGLHHSVALTGGEPLLHTDFLTRLLPVLGDLGLKAYLETNGTLAEELVKVIEHIDVVCADIKLPSSTREAPQWDNHERFLFALAANEDPSRLDFWKCIVTADCESEEIGRAAQLIASVDAQMPLILQPVTPAAAAKQCRERTVGDRAAPAITAPSPAQMLNLQAVAKHRLPHVRIIPQTHRLGGYL